MNCENCEEEAYVIDKLAKLLAEIAVIVNGPEPPLTRWSYHDLPEKVRALKQASPAAVPVADALRDSLGAMEAHARMYPHMDKGFMVDARNKAKRALSTQAPPAAVPAPEVLVRAYFHRFSEVDDDYTIYHTLDGVCEQCIPVLIVRDSAMLAAAHKENNNG